MRPTFTKVATLLAMLAIIFSGTFLAHAAEEKAFKQMIVPIGGLNSIQDATLPRYIEAIYKWGVGAAALLAVLMLVAGGLQYVLSAGNFGSTEAAKQRMSSAIYGMLILLGASLILSLVDTDLTNITMVSTKDLAKITKSATEVMDFDTSLYQLDKTEDRQEVAGDISKLQNAVSNGLITQEVADEYYRKINASFDAKYSDPDYQTNRLDKMENAWLRNGLDSPTQEEKDYLLASEKAAAYREMIRDAGTPPLIMKQRAEEYDKAVKKSTTP